jgi:hypothetical protein
VEICLGSDFVLLLVSTEMPDHCLPHRTSTSIYSSSGHGDSQCPFDHGYYREVWEAVPRPKHPMRSREANALGTSRALPFWT